MAKQITVKYYSDSNNVKKPYQASEDAAGYDVCRDSNCDATIIC